MPAFTQEQLLAAFEKKFIRTDDGCWNWMAAKTKAGYGIFVRRGVHTTAHRASHEFYVGEIPKGMQVDHLCRNIACVNPAHLEAVTPRENVMRGETVPAANAEKTHCPSGHPYEGENLVIDTGARKCRECGRARDREYAARNREKRAAANKAYRERIKAQG